MTRLTFTLAAWMSLVSVASASLAPPKEFPTFGNGVPPARVAKLLPRAPERTAREASPPEFVLTDRTEYLLNGKPCRYADVPANATIVRMEVAVDKKTVLRVHFQTRK
jgi:hypothetical protein